MTLEINVPRDTTTGDLEAVKGALATAATLYIDWEKLHNQQPDAISAPGRILLSFVDQINRELP